MENGVQGGKWGLTPLATMIALRNVTLVATEGQTPFPALRPHFPARESRHFTLRVRRFGCAGRIMMFPPIAAIDYEDIIKDHGAKPQHDDLADTANVERRVKTVGF